MHVVGLIFEANPFHNGHKHLINSAKALFPNSPFICITSTSFTMRGEISIINKFDKVKILQNESIDIILELPISYTLQSADYFAATSVSILNQIGITDIVIGCETTDIKLFEKFYNIITSNEFTQLFKNNQSKQNSHKKIFTDTLIKMGIDKYEIDEFNKPNFTLGFQYYRTIREQNLNIKLHLIKRTSDYYQKESTNSNIASASYIRETFQKNEDISKYLPYNPHFIDLTTAENNLLKIISFQTLQFPFIDPFTEINGNKEGIGNYIMKNGDFTHNYSNLLDSLKNKKYSLSRIRRVLISLLIQLKTVDFSKMNYLRILGINEIGLNYLNTLDKTTKKMIFSSPNELKDLPEPLRYEIIASKLYGILTNNPNIYLNEYKLPIRKKE